MPKRKPLHEVAFASKFVQSGTMRWADGFIAVDWGTTNRRAYRIDGHGLCDASFEDGRGVLSLAADQFAAAAAEIRSRLGDLPLLLAGMVGSTRGWVEAPYVRCPANIDALAKKLCWVEPNRTAIVPGLSVLAEGHADVMRGEEVQLFGAIASKAIPETSFVCHPGTHNKWVLVEEGRIAEFRTVMTGEMFGALRERGILADMISDAVVPGDAFREGVRRGLGELALTAELFSVRARVLLGDLDRASASSYTSGLLIGADVGVGLTLGEDTDIIIMGDPDLTRLYAAAVNEAGYGAREIDGAAAFLSGAAALARLIK